MALVRIRAVGTGISRQLGGRALGTAQVLESGAGFVIVNKPPDLRPCRSRHNPQDASLEAWLQLDNPAAQVRIPQVGGQVEYGTSGAVFAATSPKMAADAFVY